MRIFALETDVEKIKERFCHEGEREVFITYYHGLSFLFAIVREIVITITLVAVGITALLYELPMLWITVTLVALWFFFVFFNILKAYIDWAFDMIFLTTDKIILIDQTSFFRQEIKEIHIENIGSVTTQTQFWDIFSFGAIRIDLKEGLGGQSIALKYVPHAQEIAGKISEVVTYYQRYVDGSDVDKLRPRAQVPPRRVVAVPGPVSQ